MKRLALLAVTALASCAVFAQTTPQAPQQTNNNPYQYANPTQGSGPVLQDNTGRMRPGSKPVMIGGVTALDPTQMNKMYSVQGNNPSGLQDGRNLPLNEDGKLISPDGFEVEFGVPINANDPGICATPSPYIRESEDGSRANCPIVVPCDDFNVRDATVPALKYFMLRWTIVENGPGSNIDSAQVDALMTELNNDFAAFNMVFCRETLNFVTDATYYNLNVGTEDAGLKTTYGQNPGNVINVYVVNQITNPNAGGYARFPYDPFGGYNIRGGVVMGQSNSNLGTHTLAHELGHTFGLEHTFHGVDEVTPCTNCYEGVDNIPIAGASSTGDTEGDWCQDTNPHPTNSFICGDSGTDGCGVFPWANSPVDNHMSYSFCTSTFTAQQNRRMHCMIDAYLTQWTAYGGTVCGSLPPTADFVGTPTTWQSPSNVNFTDLSTPSATITSWTWDFNSAGQLGTVTPATFVGQNPPVVTYTLPNGQATCLQYEVTLTITSPTGGDVEVKTNYIEVCPPSGDCDTLDLYWTTPVSNPTIYGGLAPGEHITGVPDQSNSPGTSQKGVYERYITPNPGTTEIGAVRVGLGSLTDADDDMVFQVVVYDDAGGVPGALIGGSGPFSPTTLGVPAGNFFAEWWFPLLNVAVPLTPNFHVGVEIFPGDAAIDEMVVVASSSALNQGQFNGLNHIWSTGFGYENLLAVYGLNVDMDIIPMLGGWAPLPVITGYTENVVCDTTYVTLFDTVFYSIPDSWSFTFADGTVLNTTSDPGTINRVYTSPGPDTVQIIAVNSCGRADTTSWIIPYNFMATPDADFTKAQANPICMGAPGVDFTANTNGYSDYTWDFGDGTVVSTGGTNTANHVYTAPGLYYTTLTVTSPGYQPSDTTYLEDFEAGFPGTWARFDVDGQNAAAGVNPPFSTGNPQAWLPLDVNGTGDQEMYSNSWYNPAGTADDWMVSDLIAVGATNSLAWEGEALDPNFPDGYEVWVTTGAQTVAGCLAGTQVFTTAAENTFETTHVVDLAAAGFASTNVRVCFHNNSTDQYLLAIDNVRVGNTGPGCTAIEQKLDFVEIVDCTVPPPVASFTADVTQGCNPLTVNFTDTSTPAATSWIWDFGDGNFSIVQNPTHTYTTSGTWTVTLFATNAGGTDQFQMVITVDDPLSAAFTFNDYCQGAANGPTGVATPGGAWAFNPVPTDGATINGTTGVISNGVGGATYTVEYTVTNGTCITTSTVNVNVLPLDDPSFTFNDFCQGAANGPTGIATPGGTFVFNPLPGDGATINGSTGVISNGVGGTTYTVQYTTSGTCPSSTTVNVNVLAPDDPSFTFNDYCAGAANGPTGIATPGGTFQFDPVPTDGATINGSTGVISNGVGGTTYTVEYVTAGACPDSTTVNVTVNPLDDASFTFNDYCVGSANGPAGIATPGGNWAFNPVPTDGATINGSTGVISNGVSGASYTVEYTTPAGGCQNTSTVVVNVLPLDDASFTFNDYCVGAANGPTGIATPGGNWAFNPVPTDGATINSSTGVISNGVSSATYTVEYTTTGTCPNTSTVNVNVLPLDDATFTYPNFCATGTGSPGTVNTPGGTWAFNPVPTDGATINSSTGDISNGVAGNSYTVEYTTNGTCPNTSTVVVTAFEPGYTITITDENCGAGDGVIDLVGTGGAGGPYMYSITGGAPFQASGNFPGLSTGGYSVVIQDASGCVSTAVVETVGSNGGATINSITPVDPSCFGACDGSITITLSGGILPYQIEWYDGTSTLIQTGGLSISGLCADNYSVEVTDNNGAGCLVVGNATITDPVPVDASFTFNDYCEGSANGPTGVVTPGGSWAFNPVPTDGATINNATGVISNGVGGTAYTVEYTTPAPCPNTSTVVVNVLPLDDASFTFNDFCVGAANGPTGIATPGGSWAFNPVPTDGATINGVTGVISNGVAGNSYTVEYTTNGTCPNTSTVVVNVNTLDDASFNFLDYCEGSANGPTGIVTPGGSWAFNPVPTDGATINSGTGVISNGVGGTTYTVEYTTPAGACQNTSTVNVTVNPLDDATFSFADYCEGAANGPTGIVTPGGTFTFNPVPTDGATINGGTGVISNGVGGTTYTVEYTTAGTCPATFSVNVTVNPVDDPSFTFLDYCEGAANGPTGIATPGGQFVFNPLPTDGATIDINTGVISNGVGGTSYNVQYTTTGICPSTTTVLVTVNPLDDASFTFLDYCEGAANGPTGVATPGGSFAFNPLPTDGATINSGTGVISNGVGGTTYTVEYTTAGTCPNTSTVNVTVNPLDDATFSFADFCVTATNGPTGIVTPGGTFVFNPLPGDGATIDPSTGVISNPVAGNSYTVEYTTNGICPSTSTVTVNVTNADDPSFTFVDFCVGGTNGPTAIMTPGGTFAFNPAPGDGATIDPSTGVISNGVAGNSYTVEYTTPAGPCQSTTTVVVNALAQDDPTFSYASTTFCPGDPDPIATITGTPGGTFSGPAGVAVSSITGTITLSASTPGGPYDIEYITPGPCADTMVVQVTINAPVDTADAGVDFNACDTIVPLALNGNTPTNGTGTWSVISGSVTVDNPNVGTSTLSGYSSGVIQLEWTISDGVCPGNSDTVTITIDSCMINANLSIPTAFTPDGDGVNDVWNIQDINLYPNNTVVIFNRWGNEIFRSDGYTTPWDGTYNGSVLPVGSYYYIIDLGDGSEPLSGALTLIK